MYFHNLAQILSVSCSRLNDSALSCCAVPGEEGEGSECVVFGAPTNATACVKYEALSGAITLSNISACDAASVATVTDAAIALTGGEEATVGSGSTAIMHPETAAIGNAVHSDLSVVSEEECLVACAAYIDGCTHVTTGGLKQSSCCALLLRCNHGGVMREQTPQRT